MICTSPEEEKLPRLMFMLNGTPAEGTTDLIRAHWHSLITNKDSSIRQFGLDLFKYTIYTSGFGYGMYEFAHYAPFSVLMDVHGYTEALKSVLRSSWTDAEKENFMHQYFMNHWGDTNLLRHVNFSSLHSPIVKEGIITLTNKADIDTEKYTLPYVVVVSKSKSGKRQEGLYRIVGGGSEVSLEPAQKLGKVSKRKQVTLQYNPSIDYHLVKPVVPGNDSAWGDLSEVSSVRATRSRGLTDTDGSSTTAAPRPAPTLESMMTGKPVVISKVKAGEQVAAKPAAANAEVAQTESPIQQAETATNTTAQNSIPNLGTIKIGGLEFTPTSSLADAIVGTGVEGENSLDNSSNSSNLESNLESDEAIYQKRVQRGISENNQAAHIGTGIQADSQRIRQNQSENLWQDSGRSRRPVSDVIESELNDYEFRQFHSLNKRIQSEFLNVYAANREITETLQDHHPIE